MPFLQVRRFNRHDRDQVTALVNAHISAVVPGVSVSVQALMSHLEGEPGEFVIDPWVEERATLVVEQRGRIVAAVHLLRYSGDDRVAEHYRDSGEIRWLLYWPAATYWPDSEKAADALGAACLTQMRSWGVNRCYAEGTLPAPAVYGVSEQWPHIRALYKQLGFEHPARIEVIFVARVDRLPRPVTVPVRGVAGVRTVGVNGTRISAVIDGGVVGYIEVDTNLEAAQRMSRLGGWADIGNLHVEATYRRRGVGTWLVAQAADWLELAGVTRLLAYAGAEEDDWAAFMEASGFRVLTRTVRGLVKTVG